MEIDKNFIFKIGVALMVVMVALLGWNTLSKNGSHEALQPDGGNEVIDDEEKEGESLNIKMVVNNNAYDVTLEDNETSKDFLEMLPLTISMDELNGNEKYYYLDGVLSTNANRVNRINNGDLMLYGNSCLVLFYESFDTTYSYTRLGKVDDPTSLKNDVGGGSVIITFTKYNIN